MSNSKIWRSLAVFETGLSAAEWIWRLVTLIVIGGGGTITGFLAKADPVLKELGPIYWVGVGLITSVFVAFILFLIKSAILKQAQADHEAAMATLPNAINPLLESFTDLIIPIEDLRLPQVQLHENKHFKRCQFVGPGAVAILGGTYVNSGFVECGDIIVLPEDVFLTGIVVLKNCTVEQCKFHRTTVFIGKGMESAFASVQGAQVKGGAA